MTRLSVLTLLLCAALSPAWAEDPPKVDPSKSEPPVNTGSDLIVHKYSAGDAQAVVVKVSGSQITLKIPQQVANGYTSKSVRVPSGNSRGQTTYRTVRQQVPKYKIVQKEDTFSLSTAVKVKTVSGKASDLSGVHPGMTVLAHLSKITEARPGEKAEVHFEITRLTIPNSFTPAPGSSGSKKKT